MQTSLYYAGIGIISGFSWSLLQFLARVTREDRKERIRDYDFFKAGVTCLRNAIGAGVGVYVAPVVFGLQPNTVVAILAGFIGEPILEILQSAAKGLYKLAEGWQNKLRG